MPGYRNSELCSKTGGVHRVSEESHWYCLNDSGKRISGVKSEWPYTIKPGALEEKRVWADEIPGSLRVFDNDLAGAEKYTDELMTQMLTACGGTHSTPR